MFCLFSITSNIPLNSSMYMYKHIHIMIILISSEKHKTKCVNLTQIIAKLAAMKHIEFRHTHHSILYFQNIVNLFQHKQIYNSKYYLQISAWTIHRMTSAIKLDTPQHKAAHRQNHPSTNFTFHDQIQTNRITNTTFTSPRNTPPFHNTNN